MTGFLNRSYFCQMCKKGYNNKEMHTCNNPCVYCHQIHTEGEEKWMFCDQTVNKKLHKKVHVCHEVYCKTCKYFYAEDHLCYMQPVSNEPPQRRHQRKRAISNTFSLILNAHRTMFLNVNKVTLRERTVDVDTARNLGVAHFNTVPIFVLYIRSVIHA